jgi:hypothetical protein
MHEAGALVDRRLRQTVRRNFGVKMKRSVAILLLLVALTATAIWIGYRSGNQEFDYGTVVVLPAAGHWLLHEEPMASSQLMIDFFREGG